MDMKWQARDTAPKDGSDFLAYHADDGYSGEWYVILSYDPQGYMDFKWQSDEGYHPIGFFTHWMPLPEPPEDSQ
jgi:hypothetical protein